MDFEQIKNNLLSALEQLTAMRVIVTSRHEKAADLPALYVILAVLLAPLACAAALVLGMIFRYAVRFEKDATRKK